jgi:hypothetical protein
MRNALMVCILGLMAATSLESAQSQIAARSESALADLPAVYDQVKAPPTDSGGPPGTDEIKYDQGGIGNGWYLMDERTRYAVRMDPTYHPAIVAQCDICLAPHPWPFPNHSPIYVQIWFDRNGDGWPDFPAVWSAWAQGRDSAPDSTAIAVPVPLGQVICDSGSFWVGMMTDTVQGEREVAADDSASNHPDHQFLYYAPGDTWERYDMGSDLMIRSWTMRQGVRDIVVSAVEAPSGEIWAGDTAVPQALFANLGTGTDSALVWMRIEDTCASDNYVDSCWVRLDPLQTLDTTYRAWSPPYPGIYRMQCTTERNDTSWTYLTVLAREGMEAGALPLRFTGEGLEVGPNPVRTAATIRYSVTGKSRVEVRILDIRGRVVCTLFAGSSSPGEHLAVWNACDNQGHPSARGIYFVRLESQDCQETRKVILTR